MAERRLYKWDVWCNDEAKTYSLWAEKAPTACPYVAEHTLDKSKTKATDVIVDGAIKALIREEAKESDTGGYFQFRSHEIEVPINSDPAPYDFSKPFSISQLAVQFAAPAACVGDDIEVHISPGTAIGALTALAAIGDKTFKVSATVLDNLKQGFWVEIGGEDLGEVVKVDSAAAEITSDKALAAAKSVGDSIKMTHKMCPHLRINSTKMYRIGESKIGGSFLKANTTVRVLYKNNTGTAKTFSFIPEHLF